MRNLEVEFLAGRLLGRCVPVALVERPTGQQEAVVLLRSPRERTIPTLVCQLLGAKTRRTTVNAPLDASRNCTPCCKPQSAAKIRQPSQPGTREQRKEVKCRLDLRKPRDALLLALPSVSSRRDSMPCTPIRIESRPDAERLMSANALETQDKTLPIADIAYPL